MNNNGGGGSPPQLIRHSDGSFAVLNVNLDDLSEVQRIAVAVQLWEQARALLEASGEYKPRDPAAVGKSSGIGTTEDIDRVVAKALNVALSSVNRVRPRALRNAEVHNRALAGEIESVDDFMRALGMRVIARLDEGRPSNAKLTNSFYGSGDKFEYAIEPITRYLRAWRKKSFRFTHVNPREAKRRIKQIDNVMADLAAAREDLAQRSHVATYATPSGKRRENTQQ